VINPFFDVFTIEENTQNQRPEMAVSSFLKSLDESSLTFLHQELFVQRVNTVKTFSEVLISHTPCMDNYSQTSVWEFYILTVLVHLLDPHLCNLQFNELEISLRNILSDIDNLDNMKVIYYTYQNHGRSSSLPLFSDWLVRFGAYFDNPCPGMSYNRVHVLEPEIVARSTRDRVEYYHLIDISRGHILYRYLPPALLEVPFYGTLYTLDVLDVGIKNIHQFLRPIIRKLSLSEICSSYLVKEYIYQDLAILDNLNEQVLVSFDVNQVVLELLDELDSIESALSNYSKLSWQKVMDEEYNQCITDNSSIEVSSTYSALMSFPCDNYEQSYSTRLFPLLPRKRRLEKTAPEEKGFALQQLIRCKPKTFCHIVRLATKWKYV